MSETNIKKTTLIQALTESSDNISKACKAAGVSKTTHYKWLQSDDEYRIAIEKITGSTTVSPKITMLERIKGVSIQTDQGVVYTTPPDVSAIIAYLKKKGKKRGYVEEVENKSIVPTPAIMDWLDDDTI